MVSGPLSVVSWEVMDALPHILAETETDLPKIIFGLIFFIIWALSAFVSWMNKQQQEARRQRIREEIERAARYGGPQPARAPTPPTPPTPPRRPQRIAEGIAQRYPDVLLPPAPPPLPPPMPQAPPPQQRRPVPPVAAKPKPPQRRPQRQPQARRNVSAPVPPALPLEEVAPAPAAYVNITQPAPRAKAQTVDAASVKRWLTPATLRHQFILTEILQPPLALRPNRDEDRSGS